MLRYKKMCVESSHEANQILIRKMYVQYCIITVKIRQFRGFSLIRILIVNV